MEALRNEIYDQIERLEAQLRNEDNVNQYGFSPSPLHAQIDDLETRISETWAS